MALLKQKNRARIGKKSVRWKDFFLGFMCAICVTLLVSGANCGRTLSRLGLGDQVLQLPKDFKSMISVGFHREDNGDTVKDVTYETTDGRLRSVEYRDKPWHLEGSISWERQR